METEFRTGIYHRFLLAGNPSMNWGLTGFSYRGSRRTLTCIGAYNCVQKLHDGLKPKLRRG